MFRSLPLAVLALAGCVNDFTVNTPPDGGGGGGGDCIRTLEAAGPVTLPLGVGEQGDVAVRLTDSCAGPVAGAAVDFTVAGASDAVLDLSLATTDGDGVAHAKVSAPVAESFTVNAAQGGLPVVAFAVTVTAAVDPCAGHCGNGTMDCGETGPDCGGSCSACVAQADDAALVSDTLPSSMTCDQVVTASVTVKNAGTTTWTQAAGYKLGYVGGMANDFLPGGVTPRVDLAAADSVAPGGQHTFVVALHAPLTAGTYQADLQLLLEGAHWFGPELKRGITVTGTCATNCTFPQGVPEADFTGHTDTDATVADTVNTVMEGLSGCSRGSDCYIGGSYPDAQQWFAAVNAQLRSLGLCAGQHEEGSTDEIAVSNTGCQGLWYGYHIYNYGGSKVVWAPGAQRGSWSIVSTDCP